MKLTILALGKRDAVGIPHEAVGDVDQVEGREAEAPVKEGVEQRALGMGEAVPHGLVHARIAAPSHLLGAWGETGSGGCGGGSRGSSGRRRGRLGRWKKLLVLLLACSRVVTVDGIAQTVGEEGNGREGRWTLLLQLDEELLGDGRGDGGHHGGHVLHRHRHLWLRLLRIGLNEVVRHDGTVVGAATDDIIHAWIHHMIRAATLILILVELMVLGGLDHGRRRQLADLLLLILVVVGWHAVNDIVGEAEEHTGHVGWGINALLLLLLLLLLLTRWGKCSVCSAARGGS